MAHPSPSRLPDATNVADLGDAIVQALTYADLFDYPLTATEVHRYLPRLRAHPEEVSAALAVMPGVALHDGYHMLRGREHLAAIRRRRARASDALWPQALRWGYLLASLPFVRMVAVTGALSVDNVEPGADIDYLVVSQAGRVWCCRLLVTAAARLAGLGGTLLCPNYVLSEATLSLSNRTLYTARELVQMVPLAGAEALARIRAANAWVEALLPNASAPRPVRLQVRPVGGRLAALVQSILRARLGDRLEEGVRRFQTNRLLRKMKTGELGRGEADFSADAFRGHYDAHGQRILSQFANRAGGWSQ